MKEIRVGMMVRVVDDPGWVDDSMRWAIGKTARVLRPCGVIPGHWDLEGLERDPHDGLLMSFATAALEPYTPDSKLSTWEEVQTVCGWNPQRVSA